MSLEPHPTAVADAIRLLVPCGKITLVAIPAKGGDLVAQTFLIPEQIDDAAHWAISRNRHAQNIYWQVNDSDRVDSRIKADEVTTARYFWADIDPKCKEFGSYEQAREDLFVRILPTVAEVATFVVDSGNGLQVLFKLPKPVQ